jgi:TIR domain/AAA-like domain
MNSRYFCALIHRKIGPVKIFLSYKRNVEPDEPLARDVYSALRTAGHEVFLDQVMLTGIKWAEEIERQIRQCDCLIVFLTAASSRSEMVQSEIEMAKQWSKAILPVRVAFAGKLPHPLNAHLDPIQYSFWRAPSDSGRLIEELSKAISGLPLPSPPLPRQAESSSVPPAPGGAIDLEDPHYISREHDRQAVGLARGVAPSPGQTIVLKGPRQVGKTSLLFRMIDAAQQCEKKVAFLDFQLLEGSGLERGFLRLVHADHC